MKKQSARCVFGFAFLAASSVLSGQVFDLEHFQCYPVLKVDNEVQATVGLRDQFNDPGDYDVRRAVRFCNPTRKFHNDQLYDIADDRQHLTLHAIFPQAGPLRIALVQDQFGTRWLKLRGPSRLATPTQKEGHEAPQGLDHFQCYEANGAPVNQAVALSDQFIPAFTGHYVLDPIGFCNPVEKRHGGASTEIQHPDMHLTCYSMTRVPFSAVKQITNQFGVQKIEVGPPDRLCVPSRKLYWQVIPDGAPAGRAEDAQALIP
jgi:hypothetical protein